MCCGYSKEPSQQDGFFNNPKHMFILIGKENNCNFMLKNVALSQLMMKVDCLEGVSCAYHNNIFALVK